MAEWEIIYNCEPWGDKQADYRAGVIASTVENWSQKKSQDWVNPGDFFPSCRKPKLTRKQLRQKMDLMFTAMAGAEGVQVANG